MQHRGVQPLQCDALTPLKDTAGVAGDDNLRLHRSDIDRFAVQEFLGGAVCTRL